MATAPPEETWGSCRYCGTAVAPGATTCGICGEDRPVRAGTMASAPREVRRRIRFTNGLRAIIVVGVAVALGYTLLAAALSGPPSVQDPLTTAGVYTIAPGATAILTGNITGGDYIIGNFTSVQPFGANVTISAYNLTSWTNLIENGSGAPLWSSPSEGSGRIVFTAEYTDTYTFVLTNPYPASTHLNITVYVATEYESNVGDDGFG
jgi:hypothetical protein